jgi:hypothetical protein
LVDNAYIGDVINAVHYVTVVSADGETLTVSGLPSAMSDRVAIIGQEILGNGIPNDTVITNILGNVLYVTNPTSELVDPVAGDLIGYRIINQRSGIWELNINQDNFVTLKFIKEIAQGDVVKVLGGQSFGSCFLRYSRSIDQGNTVPEFENVPHNLSYNATGGGNGTTFDMGGTKIIERRDAPGTESNPIKDWKPRTYYPIGSIVKANSQIWVAVVNVMPTVNFVEKDDRITADRPAVPFIYWKLYDSIPLSGDKYLKFPQTGVFN